MVSREARRRVVQPEVAHIEVTELGIEGKVPVDPRLSGDTLSPVSTIVSKHIAAGERCHAGTKTSHCDPISEGDDHSIQDGDSRFRGGSIHKHHSNASARVGTVTESDRTIS